MKTNSTNAAGKTRIFVQFNQRPIGTNRVASGCCHLGFLRDRVYRKWWGLPRIRKTWNIITFSIPLNWIYSHGGEHTSHKHFCQLMCDHRRTMQELQHLQAGTQKNKLSINIVHGTPNHSTFECAVWLYATDLQVKELYNRLEIDNMLSTVTRSRLRWYGHLQQKDDMDWVTCCTEYEVSGYAGRRRGRKTWKECVESDSKSPASSVALYPDTTGHAHQCKLAIKITIN